MNIGIDIVMCIGIDRDATMRWDEWGPTGKCVRFKQALKNKRADANWTCVGSRQGWTRARASANHKRRLARASRQDQESETRTGLLSPGPSSAAAWSAGEGVFFLMPTVVVAQRVGALLHTCTIKVTLQSLVSRCQDDPMIQVDDNVGMNCLDCPIPVIAK